MKRLCLFFVLMIGVMFCNELIAQEACFNYKGEWSEWTKYSGTTNVNSTYSSVSIKSNTGKIYFHFNIVGLYREPSKQEIKEHLKRNQWYEYDGYIEYTVNDEYPTAEAIAKAAKFYVPNARIDETPAVTRKVYGKIRIAPYKRHPQCYNIWFDDIGIAISIRDLKFKF